MLYISVVRVVLTWIVLDRQANLKTDSEGTLSHW